MGVNMEAKKRISYPLGMFDLVKGLGMILIVVAHTTFYIEVSSWLFILIRSFAGLMGMYFAINGFSFRAMPVKASVKKCAKTYLPPYFRLARIVLICLLFCPPISNFFLYILSFALGIQYGTRIGPFFLQSVSMGWFFLALFWGSILLNLILKISNRYLRLSCIIVITAIGIHLEHISFGYYCLCRGFQALPAMYIGYCVYTQNLLDRSGSVLKKAIPYLLFAATIPICVYLADVDGLRYSSLWLEILCDVIWGYAALCFAKDTVSFTNNILELIRKVGRYSSWIMIVHTLEMICFPWELVPRCFSNHQNIYFFAVVILRSVFIFLGCILMQKIDKLERQYRRKGKSNRKTRQNAAVGMRKEQ